MSFVYGAPTPDASSASGVEESLTGVKKAAADQLKWNRPTTSNPWAQQFSAPDGSIHQEFTGPMAGAQGNLMAEALRNMGSATDFNQFNSGTGDDFRGQAIAGAQGQMNDWLSPLQGGFDNAEKTRLLNAGYEEGSPQFQAMMAKGGGSAQDLQSSLGNAAIGFGTQGGARRQGMDLLAKQQGLAEALRKRSLPMEQLSIMQRLGQQPGVDADDNILNGAGMDFEAKLNKYMGDRGAYEQAQADEIATGLGLGTDLFTSALSLGSSGISSRKNGKK